MREALGLACACTAYPVLPCAINSNVNVAPLMSVSTDDLQASDINALFGFRLECTERLGDQDGIWAWKRLNSLFNWLPLAATIEDRVLCMHGGATMLHALHSLLTHSSRTSRQGSWTAAWIDSTCLLPMKAVHSCTHGSEPSEVIATPPGGHASHRQISARLRVPAC